MILQSNNYYKFRSYQSNLLKYSFSESEEEAQVKKKVTKTPESYPKKEIGDNAHGRTKVVLECH